jgi:hypothetical protein
MNMTGEHDTCSNPESELVSPWLIIVPSARDPSTTNVMVTNHGVLKAFPTSAEARLCVCLLSNPVPVQLHLVSQTATPQSMAFGSRFNANKRW